MIFILKIFNLLIILSVVNATFVFQEAGARTLDSGLKISMNKIRKEEAGMLISRPDPSSEALYADLVAASITSLEDYTLWLKSNFVYKKDAPGTDIWSLPRETLLRRSGDCEDLAFLNKAVLEMLGYRARVLCVVRAGENHAICVFLGPDGYYVVDNTRVFKTNISEQDRLFAVLAKAYSGSGIVEIALDKKGYNLLFEQANLAASGPDY